ncbi:MAG: hypothetical protein Fur0037_13260 [Planctomycetota bacterium]
MSRAPELPASLRWIDQPFAPRLSATLKGHVVLLIFWRLGCVHSRLALRDVERLHRAFAGRSFAAIALHAPRCEGERDLDRLRRALDELDVTVAAAVDPELEAFDLFRADAWPTLVLIDAAGEVRFCGKGEPSYDRFWEAIDALLIEAEADALIASRPYLPLRRQRGYGPMPCSLCAHGGSLWVSDSARDRVLALDPWSGGVRMAVGGGRGFADGERGAARFCRPKGLCALGPSVLVADEGNHALRLIAAGGVVETVLGTGNRAHDRLGGGSGTSQGLASPAAVRAIGGKVGVAMAGMHQVWTFDPESRAARAWIGCGEQGCCDGGDEACFSEPRALEVAGGELVVADAGSGALRGVNPSRIFARTIAGGFARPCGLAVHRGAILVSDAWAGRVCRCEAGEVSPLLDREAGLVEPEGLAMLGDELYVADPGAGCLFAVDLAAADALSTLRVIRLPAD